MSDIRDESSDEPGRADMLRAVVPSTIAFTVCFAAWVVNGVLIASLRKEGIFEFSTGQVAWLLSLPILTGAISRVPLGILTDRFGGRPVLTVLMLLVAAPMFWLSAAEEFSDFLVASLGFGLAGGSFAVGVGFVSASTSKKRQGFALGVFGMGNAGAAMTTLVAPSLLASFTADGRDGWRLLPKCYAVLLVVTAVLFFLTTRNRKPPGVRSLGAQLVLLKDPVVWRFGLYYFFVFGGFVALAQWVVPYGVSVYELSVAQAGLVASAFSLPSGVIRAVGGWLSDRFGARSVSYWVFGSSVVVCSLLAIPKMDITSQGRSITAQPPGGEVTVVTTEHIRVGAADYRPAPRPATLPSEEDRGDRFLPAVTSWQEPAVSVGDTVVPKQLVARGVTRIYYPANFKVFVLLLILIGMATGIGKASVYKFIPDHFPDNVGAVGGMVGLLGALGGFALPPLFGALLEWSGLWASCWIVLGLLSAVCLFSMHWVARQIVQDEVPELAQLIERRPVHVLRAPMAKRGEGEVATLEALLHEIPFFGSMTPEELKDLANLGDTKTVRAGQEVFHEGDEGDALYVILSGAVSVHQGQGDSRVELASLDKGQFFGEMALIDGNPRSATVVAMEDSEFFLLDRADFLRRLSTTPRMLADVLVGLSTTVRRTSRAIGASAPPEAP